MKSNKEFQAWILNKMSKLLHELLPFMSISHKPADHNTTGHFMIQTLY